MKILGIFLSLITLVGCAGSHRIMTIDQRRQMYSEDRYIASHRDAIYASISTARAQGALVEIPDDLASSPVITPGNSPLSIELSKQSTASGSPPQDAKVCYFVAAPAVAVNPVRSPCRVWRDQASVVSALRAQHQAFAAALGPTMELTQIQVAQIAALDSQMKTVTSSLKSSSDSQGKLNAILKETIEKFAATYTALQGKLDDIGKRLEAIK